MSEDKLDYRETELSERLSDYIDKLNEEKEPEEHGSNSGADPQANRLYAAVRMVRGLREPSMPGEEHVKKAAERIAQRVSEESSFADDKKIKPSGRKGRRFWFAGAAAAVVLLAVILFNLLLPINGFNIVNAMDQAYRQISAYHGTIEITDINALGQEEVQSVIEVWADDENRYYMKKITGANSGLITVNNGQQKWQLDPGLKQARLFPAFPDAYRFTFQLGSEVEDVKNALEVKVTGEDTVAGRKADVLEVVPDGGLPYRLWVDSETRLPLRKESSMYNALQYRVTYADIELLDAIPVELLTYSLPEDYTEIDNDPEQIVNNMEEAAEIAGFVPLMPESVPDGFRQDGISVGISEKTVRLYYSENDNGKRIIVMQGAAENAFKPVPTAILGSIDGIAAEIQSPVQMEEGVLAGGIHMGMAGISSVRWHKDGVEYAVIGDASLEQMAVFVAGLSGASLELPADESDVTGVDFVPHTEVQVDMEIEQNEQKSVDAGHSPWRLDPVYVAQVFVSLQMSPEGITGDYPVGYEDLKVLFNNGTAAIIEVEDGDSPISKVYLKRLVRQDDTGIWTVTGYDPA